MAAPVGRLGLPTRLATLGIRDTMFEGIVQRALADHSHATNPREASPRDYQEILKQAQ